MHRQLNKEKRKQKKLALETHQKENEKVSDALSYLEKSNKLRASVFKILYKILPNISLMIFFPIIFEFKVNSLNDSSKQEEREKLILEDLRNFIFLFVFLLLSFYLIFA